mmetsp:Transcript_11407/g.36434  ORF Transcript_11407/g.36434 Transcript_11407/m.36434 type:complete len:521 (+) Transcript_11407:39-1601(+)|eukprot:CAMPEP_0196773806 /NCGR_PEP_ID=MMETSP1104-20130614/2992_1 /TAXON_ID=33652 /ORGANISM="Cafeteria sp., Strain Caron Lab Isolate" /LENGTH=520 /DNA_ID=CAMNT_0042143957 /DNA_START=20 /DNA_END=1582 /DNA_ORIENTATION=-
MSEEKQSSSSKRKTGLNISHKKLENFPDWYSQVITQAEMIDYYDISGCYVLRPWAYSIWESIQRWFDAEIKKLGVKNAYFPLFVPRAALEREKDHVEGFAPEVAWVTKSGSSDLAEPIAIRPTSETIMYPAYSRWIRSHRDLPLRLNQWTNVVRWEFKNPTPFIRTREFLWQEGHSAFATKAEADEEVLAILDLYARVYEELLAVPVIKGRKSEVEKFAGGLYTTTVEAFVPATGRAIQGATSHSLGQNFARMFNISFETDEGGSALAWQNSWGLTTRTIGVMVMVHGDDHGLVLPPRVAPVQVVVVPVFRASTAPELVKQVTDTAERISRELREAGIRVELDDRSNVTAGWKYNSWEQKGVPLRIEVGPKDVEREVVVFARRDKREKEFKREVPLASSMPDAVRQALDDIHAAMLDRARRERDARLHVALGWTEFVDALNGGNMVLAPWCQRMECEEAVKERTGPQSKDPAVLEAASRGLSGAAKSLCLPFGQTAPAEGQTCFACEHAANAWCMWGRSY